jgi:hypothetical protein
MRENTRPTERLRTQGNSNLVFLKQVISRWGTTRETKYIECWPCPPVDI